MCNSAADKFEVLSISSWEIDLRAQKNYDLKGIKLSPVQEQIFKVLLKNPRVSQRY